MPVIDIHPHIVSPDTKQYPLAPRGGTQSTWSSERPTTYDMLLAAMDKAGVDKAHARALCDLRKSERDNRIQR